MIGESIKRLDALGKVTGQTLYPGDIDMPEQAYMKILFAGRPHARIRSIDTSTAEALPGVLAVFTAKDVPVNEYGLIMDDQPVLCGPGSPKPFTDRVRFVGDQVALVVAETEAIAAQGRDLIQVDYEDLPVVTDFLEARQPGAPLLHPERELKRILPLSHPQRGCRRRFRPGGCHHRRRVSHPRPGARLPGARSRPRLHRR